jgi:peroxiredoxin
VIKIGDHLPAGTLDEFIDVETEGCALGPNQVDVLAQVKGKKIVIFGVPGAFTPTCSAKHVPDFIATHDALAARGVDEIWCLSVNDPFVMGAWGRDQKSAGKVRMIADGSADYTRKLGLEQDLSKRGLGIRCQRFSMLIEDGVVRTLDIDPAGTFDKTDARTMLSHLD